MPVEHIDRFSWLTLGAKDQALWEHRLLDQWEVPLRESYDMWVDGEEIVAVRRWKRDGDGKRVHMLETLGQIPTYEVLLEEIRGIREELVQLRRLLAPKTSISVQPSKRQQP